MLDQIVSGPCIIMEIRQENAVASFKALCGCYDPKIGSNKAGEKDTLR
jgi:nucleoside-diphosphate kinase